MIITGMINFWNEKFLFKKDITLLQLIPFQPVLLRYIEFVSRFPIIVYNSPFQISLRRGCAIHSIFQRGEFSFVFRAKTIYSLDYSFDTVSRFVLEPAIFIIGRRGEERRRIHISNVNSIFVLFCTRASNLSNAGSITRRITRHSRKPLLSHSLFYSIVYSWIRSNLSQYNSNEYIFRPAAEISLFPDAADRYAR